MAFGFLKKIAKVVTTPVKAVVTVAKKVAPVVKLAAPLLKPVIEAVVPSPVKMLVKVVKKIPLAANIINRITKGKFMATDLQTKLASVVTQGLEMQGKSGTDLAFSAAFLLQNLVSLVVYANGLPKQQLLDEALVAVDGLVGDEPGALIGPNGSLVKLDIPYVPDEKLYDLILSGVHTSLSEANAPAGVASADSPG